MTATSRRGPLLLIAALLGLAIGGPWLAPMDPLAMPDPVGLANLPPSWQHPFGTDPYSRDVLSRVLSGARVSLGIAFLAVTVAITLGTGWGGAAALAPRPLGSAMMRLTDAMFAIPRLLLLLVLLAASGPLRPLSLALVLGATGWMTTSRLVFTETTRLRETAWMQTGLVLGLPRMILLRDHLLASLLPTIATAAVVALAAAVPLEAGLSFLGLGVQPPLASWGNIIHEAEGRVLDRWWLVVFPTAAIVLTALIAQGLADRLQRSVTGEPR